MKILSGKKLRLVIFGLLLVMAIGFLVSQPNRSRYEGKELLLSNKNIDTKVLNNINKKDTDNDGLKDWEEELWNTDPNNPDTDEDGTKDGDEVDAGRNPNLTGPDDEYQEDVFIKQRQQDFLDENFTETEKLSQNLFGNYLLKRSSSKQLTEKDKSDLINSALQDISNLEIQVKQYTISDISVSNDSSKIFTKNYGNKLGDIILKHSFKTDNELTIFNRSLTNDDKDEIKKLDLIINGYKDILKDALVVVVPIDATEEHLTFVQGIALIISSIENMRVIYDDPVRAMAGLEEHRKGAILLTEAFNNMELYFKDKDIVFSSEETGIILTGLI
ncbi:MAG: hypothetical protein ACE5F2_02430 [Candidatus Paceibacteria bacterium]